MKLRSGLILQGNSFPNFSKKAPCNSTTTDISAMSKAMTNPLVLDSIFANIDITDLKTARLVCREWGDVGAGLLGKRAFLDVNKIYRYDGSKLCQATPVNDKLMRSLVIRDEFDSSAPTTTTGDVFSKVFSGVPPLPRAIKFYVTTEECPTAFLDGLRTLKSTQIQQICIIIQSRNPFVDNDGPILALGKLPVQENLTSLKLQIPKHMEHGGYGIHAFHSLIQVLIDSAPKLTSLDVMASSCPSLEGCKNLKFLKFFFALCSHESCTDFEVATVTKMLTPVKDSLIELELGYTYVYPDGIYEEPKLEMEISQDRNLDLPVMSNLTSLTINSPFVYLIQDFFDEEHLPKLRNLSFQNHYLLLEVTDFSTLLNLWKPHRGVTSFVLEARYYCGPEGKFRDQIVHLFPAVKKFNLSLNSCEDCVDEVVILVHLWDLEEVKVVVEHPFFASWVVDFLRIMAIWEGGVKSIHFKDATIRQSDFSAYIQDIILHSRGFESVEFSGIVVPEIVDEMRRIFEAGGASVQFKGGVHPN